MIKFAVIVTYYPDLCNVKRLVDSLIAADVFPVIVDNSDCDVLEKNDFELCEVINLSNNKGIAAAQNIGIEFCRSARAGILIFFDQDSVIPDSFFLEELFSPIVKADELITAPIYMDNNRGFTYPIVSINKFGFRKKLYPNAKDPSFHTNVAISSGTAVSSKVFSSVGVMNENLFIDYVDTEWCLRCYRESISILVVPSAVMSHSIGDDVIDLFFLKAPVHSAFRRYYRIRNSIWLLHFAHVPKILALREACFSVLHQLIIICLKENKQGQLKSLWRGLYDGIFQFKNKNGS